MPAEIPDGLKFMALLSGAGIMVNQTNFFATVRTPTSCEKLWCFRQGVPEAIHQIHGYAEGSLFLYSHKTAKSCSRSFIEM